MAAKATPLEDILEEAKADSKVDVPYNLGNEALLKVIALFYLTKYEQKPRGEKELWAFMSQPIPELYKSLFEIWTKTDKHHRQKRFWIAVEGPTSTQDISVKVAAYLNGRGRYGRYILKQYLNNALVCLYGKKS